MADEKGEVVFRRTTFENCTKIRVVARAGVKRGGGRHIDVAGVEFKALDKGEPGTFDASR